ncbi:TPA: hypothetical protein DF272_00625 [Candidatus Falkowbacteria bacterium]|nr:hypothetical protein [Candidatus Falkowbacteria bacterium]
MPLDIVKGEQWGDEGKANIINFLLKHFRYKYCLRFQGGDNAGGTAWVRNLITGLMQKFVHHLVPPGVFYDDTICILTAGVTVNPESLAAELAAINALGYSTENVLISARCPVILPSNRLLDSLDKGGKLGTAEIGTTGKGIGPTYEYFFSRHYSLCVQEVVENSESVLRANLARSLTIKNLILNHFGLPSVTVDQEYDFLMQYRDVLAKHMHKDVTGLINDALKAGEEMVGYIAHGTELCVGNGTRPFVTSSFCTTGAACVYAGIPPQAIRHVYGIFKAYPTRVDAGFSPFPTEIFGELAEDLRRRGHEYGSTTGRPRRVGWLDLAQLRHAFTVDGVTHPVMTKMDVLNGFGKVYINSHYLMPDGSKLDHFVAEKAAEFKAVNDIEFDGWDFFGDPEAKRFIRCIEDQLGRIALISLGPSIDDVFFRA